MFNIQLGPLQKNILKNGFVKMVDCMPRVIPLEAKKLNCDSAVVQAARVSYAEGLKDFDSDKSLIRYLYKNKHTSPFEMVKFKFHVKAPLFVARQWFRHRMSNYNEISGRYSVLDEEIYKPEKVSSQSNINKQLSANDNLLETDLDTKRIFNQYMTGSSNQYLMYKQLLDRGVSRETARIGLPLNLFTEFYWCIDLHNLLNFIKLRNSDYAQGEIKEYAKSIEELIEPLCPVTIEAHKEFKTITLSPEQVKALDLFEFQADKLKKRERMELENLVKGNIDYVKKEYFKN